MEEFNQLPSEKRPPWKIIALIIAGVVGIVLIVIIVMMILKNRQAVQVEVQTIERIETQLDESLAACAQEPDPEECRQKKIDAVARSTGEVSLCEKLSDEDRDECVWKIARDQQSPELCAEIVDEENRATCSDTLYSRIAIDSKDSELCEKISSEELKNNCIGTIAGPLTVENCSERGESELLCADIAMTAKAIASNDSSLCAQINDEGERSRCNELAVSVEVDADGDGLNEEQESNYGSSDQNVDTDSDGLTDVQEIKKYKTDPANPDTDGDSYPDGSEVENGYNPNGAGKLES